MAYTPEPGHDKWFKTARGVKTYISISFLPANSIFRQRWHNQSFVLNGFKSDVLIYWWTSLRFTREIKYLIVAVSRRLYMGHNQLTRDWKGSINRDNGLSMIHASMTRLLNDLSLYRHLKLTVYLTGYRKELFAGCISVCGTCDYCLKWRTNAEPMATLMLSVNWSLTETFTAVMHSILKLLAEKHFMARCLPAIELTTGRRIRPNHGLLIFTEIPSNEPINHSAVTATACW